MQRSRRNQNEVWGFGVLHCTFSTDTERVLLPVTDNEAGEDVAEASVTDTWWCSPCPSPIPPTALASPFLSPERDLSLQWVRMQKREDWQITAVGMAAGRRTSAAVE